MGLFFNFCLQEGVYPFLRKSGPIESDVDTPPPPLSLLVLPSSTVLFFGEPGPAISPFRIKTRGPPQTLQPSRVWIFFFRSFHPMAQCSAELRSPCAVSSPCPTSRSSLFCGGPLSQGGPSFAPFFLRGNARPPPPDLLGRSPNHSTLFCVFALDIFPQAPSVQVSCFIFSFETPAIFFRRFLEQSSCATPLVFSVVGSFSAKVPVPDRRSPHFYCPRLLK